MRTRGFFIQIALLVGASLALIILFSTKLGNDSYNYWPVVVTSMAYWLLHGAAIAHEKDTDLISSVVVLRRVSSTIYWLLPVAVGIGFL